MRKLIKVNHESEKLINSEIYHNAKKYINMQHFVMKYYKARNAFIQKTKTGNSQSKPSKKFGPKS